MRDPVLQYESSSKGSGQLLTPCVLHRLLLLLPLEIEEGALMLVRSTSEGGCLAPGSREPAGKPRRVPLGALSASTGDLHMKLIEKSWVAKAAESTAASVRWLGIEDLSAGGQQAGSFREVFDSATSSGYAESPEAAGGSSCPKAGSRPPQSDTLLVPPGSSPGLRRSDLAQEGPFAAQAQSQRPRKTESDTSSAEGALWGDGELSIVLDDAPENDRDEVRDSALER
jgi:hypothetical protein